MTEVKQKRVQKPDPVQLRNAQVRKACLELEAEAKAALPEGSFLHTIYVSEALARGGYSLARKYNPTVCNGLTVILAVHPTSVEIFASVCSKEDQYNRLDGRFEVLKRLALKYNASGVLPVEMTPLSVHVQKADLLVEGVPETLENVVRGAVNLYIKDHINNKAKPKQKAFAPTREQVANAEQALLAVLQQNEGATYRLAYQYKVPKTGRRAVIMRPVAIKQGLDVAFEETTVKAILTNPVDGAVEVLSATVTRYNGDANNRLTARWFALKKLTKLIQRNARSKSV